MNARWNIGHPPLRTRAAIDYLAATTSLFPSWRRVGSAPTTVKEAPARTIASRRGLAALLVATYPWFKPEESLTPLDQLPKYGTLRSCQRARGTLGCRRRRRRRVQWTEFPGVQLLSEGSNIGSIDFKGVTDRRSSGPSAPTCSAAYRPPARDQRAITPARLASSVQMAGKAGRSP